MAGKACFASQTWAGRGKGPSGDCGESFDVRRILLIAAVSRQRMRRAETRAYKPTHRRRTAVSKAQTQKPVTRAHLVSNPIGEDRKPTKEPGSSTQLLQFS